MAPERLRAGVVIRVVLRRRRECRLIDSLRLRINMAPQVSCRASSNAKHRGNNRSRSISRSRLRQRQVPSAWPAAAGEWRSVRHASVDHLLRTAVTHCVVTGSRRRDCPSRQSARLQGGPGCPLAQLGGESVANWRRKGPDRIFPRSHSAIRPLESRVALFEFLVMHGASPDSPQMAHSEAMRLRILGTCGCASNEVAAHPAP